MASLDGAAEAMVPGAGATGAQRFTSVQQLAELCRSMLGRPLLGTSIAASLTGLVPGALQEAPALKQELRQLGWHGTRFTRPIDDRDLQVLEEQLSTFLQQQQRQRAAALQQVEEKKKKKEEEEEEEEKKKKKEEEEEEEEKKKKNQR